MSQSKKKEQEVQRRLAKARKRIEILNELKDAGLNKEDAPLIAILPSVLSHKTVTPSLSVRDRSHRTLSNVEKAVISKESRCLVLLQDYRRNLRHRLALRFKNPVFLREEKTSWIELHDSATRKRTRQKKLLIS